MQKTPIISKHGDDAAKERMDLHSHRAGPDKM